MPFPRSRNTLPLCVPDGIFIVTFPSSVGPSMVAPSAAWVKLMGTSQMTSVSSRMKIGCSWTCTTTYRSPGGPPLSPDSPSPVSLSRVPVSTPGGTFTVSTLSVSTLPAPRQVMHGSVMTLRSEEHTSELQSRSDLVCRLLLEKKKTHVATA